MVSYQRLTAGDASWLARVGGLTILESHGSSAPPEIMQSYIDRSFSEDACRAELSDAQNIFTAVDYKGQRAGYSKIILNTPHPMVDLDPVTKLERLYLLKDFYGLKLGHGLLQAAVNLSKEGGDKGMWLDVWKGNERAIRFYGKQGFETVGEAEFVLTSSRVNPIWVMLLRH